MNGLMMDMQLTLPMLLRRAELYFVHRGTATFLVDGEEHEVGEGGLVHVESTTPRRVCNRTDDDLVLFIVGGKDGYVERDGHVTSDEELAKRQAMKGDMR